MTRAANGERDREELILSRSLFVAVALLVAGVGVVAGGWFRASISTAAAAFCGILLLVAGALIYTVVGSLREPLERRRRAEEALRRSAEELTVRNEGLQLVTDLAQRLHRSLDVEAVAREAVEVLVSRNGPPLVAVYLLEEEGKILRLVGEHGFSREELAIGERMPVRGSLSGVAIGEQRLVTTDDVQKDERVWPPIGRALGTHGIVSGLAIPLAFGGSPLGTLNLMFRERRSFEPVELDSFRAIGQEVSLALANARHVAGLEHQAFHDALTGLPNRASLHRRFAAHLANGPDADPAGLILLDLNRFQEINDALGHRLGDDLLVEVGSRLSAACRGRRAGVFRLGGDEFAVLLFGLEGRADAETEAEVLLGALGQPFAVAGMRIRVGASAGVAVAPEDGTDSHELLRRADVAMYRAKRTAGGVASYARELDQNTPERLELLSELAAAIRDGGLVLHFQPKVRLATGVVTGFECLVRWQHPRLGLLLPGAFLPLAEASDVMFPLTYWVVENALAQLKRWGERSAGLSMAINLSVRNLLDRSLSQRLEEIVGNSGVDPSRVVFELTETAVMTDPEAAAATLDRITSAGARLAIDDFGTGYSSLVWLSRLPVHEIKIDRSFVGDMMIRDQHRAIVRSTVQLAHSLELSVVAEGIEDARTARALRDMACDEAQGYLFARPAPADEAVAVLAKGSLLGPD